MGSTYSTAVQNLKPGDIKQFTIDNRRTITGIWCGKLQLSNDTDSTDYILSFEGRFERALYITGVKAVRLKPEQRKQLEKAAAQVKEMNKLSAGMHQARQKIIKCGQAANTVLKQLRTSTGVMNEGEFRAYITDKLAPAVQKLTAPYKYRGTGFYSGCEYGYRFEILASDYAGAHHVYMALERSIDFDKYADPDKYPFLFREYDGQLMIWSEPEKIDSYKALMQKYNKYNIPAKRNSDTITNRSGIDVGDKGILTHHHSVGISTAVKDYTKETADKLCERFLGVFQVNSK